MACEISVIVPTYDGEVDCHDTGVESDSVCAPAEVIVVDDG